MNTNISPTLAHLIAGLAGIGALASLAATGTISSTDAVGPIVGIISFLLGASAVAIGSSSTPPASALTPLVPAPVVPASQTPPTAPAAPVAPVAPVSVPTGAASLSVTP